jgi:hypothetical protein
MSYELARIKEDKYLIILWYCKSYAEFTEENTLKVRLHSWCMPCRIRGYRSVDLRDAIEVMCIISSPSNLFECLHFRIFSVRPFFYSDLHSCKAFSSIFPDTCVLYLYSESVRNFYLWRLCRCCEFYTVTFGILN